jgi:hypothetical protein
MESTPNYLMELCHQHDVRNAPPVDRPRFDMVNLASTANVATGRIVEQNGRSIP